MAEEIDLAGLLRPGDRLAWSAGPMEPTDLLGVLDRQLDRVPRSLGSAQPFVADND